MMSLFGNKTETSVLVFVLVFTFSWPLKNLKKLLELPNLELNCLLSRFYRSLRSNKKSMKWGIKNINCSFIRGMVANYFALGKSQPWGQLFPPFPLQNIMSIQYVYNDMYSSATQFCYLL